MKKIQNISKYAFIVFLGLSFFSSITYGACSGYTGSSNDQPLACFNFSGAATLQYDNRSQSLGTSSMVFLKMFELSDLACGNDKGVGRVKAIQTKMQEVGGACSVCIDGKFGNTTRSRLSNCAQIYCSSQGSGLQAPNLSGDNFVCNSGYTFNSNSKCCAPITCTNQPTNGVCGSGFTLENGCCVAQCDKPQDQKKCPDGEDRVEEKCKCVCNPTKGCCGVKLNTVVPFIGDCIEMTNGNDTTMGVNQLNAFPYLMKGLTKILITAIMIFSIIIVIVAGFLMSTSIADQNNYKKGLGMLKNVIICLILLGCSGLILKLVNPNFFG